MALVKHHKVVAALPSQLDANAIYYVRAGAGFDLYVTNSSGQIVAYPVNTPGAGIVYRPVQATTSGTSVDFVGLPGAVKRMAMMLNGVSFNGNAQPRVRLGSSAGIETSGYVGSTTYVTASAVGGSLNSAGMDLVGSASAPVVAVSGVLNFELQDPNTNTWLIHYQGTRSDGGLVVNQHSTVIKSLAGPIDRVRLTSSTGTDLFDAGSVSLMYES